MGYRRAGPLASADTCWHERYLRREQLHAVLLDGAGSAHGKGELASSSSYSVTIKAYVRQIGS